MEGRDIYIREGCNVCHSQMIRPFRAETERYGHYSVAGEHVWEHPFLWGSKRTGPDLARVGGRYSDDWHRAHLIDPRSVVPESNMPSFKWLEENKLDGALTAKKLETFNMLTRNRGHKDENGNQFHFTQQKRLLTRALTLKVKRKWKLLLLTSITRSRIEVIIMDYGTLRGLIALLILALFIIIVVWAYSKKRKSSFDKAANSIFEEDRKEKKESKQTGD